MGKDRWQHRGGETSSGVVRRIQSAMDRARERIASHEMGEEHELQAVDFEHTTDPYTRLIDRTPQDQEIVLFDSLATGYFAPEAVLQRQIDKVRFDIQKECLDTRATDSMPPQK